MKLTRPMRSLCSPRPVGKSPEPRCPTLPPKDPGTLGLSNTEVKPLPSTALRLLDSPAKRLRSLVLSLSTNPGLTINHRADRHAASLADYSAPPVELAATRKNRWISTRRSVGCFPESSKAAFQRPGAVRPSSTGMNPSLLARSPTSSTLPIAQPPSATSARSVDTLPVGARRQSVPCADNPDIWITCAAMWAAMHDRAWHKLRSSPSIPTEASVRPRTVPEVDQAAR
jgi:hypothetical protein